MSLLKQTSFIKVSLNHMYKFEKALQKFYFHRFGMLSKNYLQGCDVLCKQKKYIIFHLFMQNILCEMLSLKVVKSLLSRKMIKMNCVTFNKALHIFMLLQSLCSYVRFCCNLTYIKSVVLLYRVCWLDVDSMFNHVLQHF